MPLPFDSLSHGRIAFGFFNIKTDLMLLENYFFFAEDFCKAISDMAKEGPYYIKRDFEVHEIEDPSQIGDLMAAIHGISFRGFIGRLYTIFPFPSDPQDFKQDPEGFKNRGIVQDLLSAHATRRSIPFEVDPASKTIRLGRYLFDSSQFGELLRYVWEGGYPRWKGGIRPEYVLQMARATQESKNPLILWFSI